MNMQNTIGLEVIETRKIGRNRGKPRLWLEGAILTAAGFPHAQRWILVEHIQGLDIIAVGGEGKDWNGNRVRKVSGKADRPVIDISGGSLKQCAHVGGEPWDSVSLSYEPGSGFIAVRFDYTMDAFA